MKKVNNWLTIIQDYCLPPTCLLCENKGFNSQDICLSCLQDMIKNTNCCYRCAAPLPEQTTSPLICGQCITHPPIIDNTYTPFLYQDMIRFLILSLKFSRQYKNVRLLGHLLSEYLKQTADLPDLIIPVPLHKQRLKQRHFNQALEIAKIVSTQLNTPIDTKICIRNRDTPQQSQLSAKQRGKNVKNAFTLKYPPNAQHIAIIDDVFTTGSTLNEIARILKKSGVTRVDAWVIARA